MVAFLLDIGAGWIIAKSVKNLLLALLAALVLGAVSSAIGAYLLGQTYPSVIGERQMAVQFVIGLLWHPIVTGIAMGFFRHLLRKAKQQAPGVAEKSDASEV